MAAMPVSHTDAAWADTELDGLRKQVIAHIEALQCADGSCGSIPDLCAGTDPTGDINQSGLTDVADVQCMALVGMWKYYGEEGPSPQCALAGTSAADLSCDGVVTVTDIKVAVLLALDLKLPTFLDEDHNRCVDACE